jgi:hypothetical protein
MRQPKASERPNLRVILMSGHADPTVEEARMFDNLGA